MSTLTTILIPYNFSESASTALEYGLSFAEEGPRSQIVLLYIADESLDPDKRSELDANFKKIKEKTISTTSKVDLSYHVTIGNMVDEILMAKSRFNTDLIIMGTSGTLGSDEGGNTNTQKLVQTADCPVLVIPKSLESFDINIITLALDKGAIEDPEILNVLLAIARRHEAEIHVLTIFEEGDSSYLKEHENENILKYYFEKYYTHNSSIISDNIADSIVQYDQKNAIDLLAILPRNHAKKGPPSKGKLTQFLTRRTDIPLLVID